MHPTSPNLWTLRSGGDAEACDDFEKDEEWTDEKAR